MEREPSEIEKLTERIEKDPKSKLFVPLAEEYKKLGDLEMAVHVLTEGLKHNPGYITAKSFLGRLLLERGELEAAKKEFEAVVKAIPDNLLAQRKLGDICALQVDHANALRHYRAVLALNSKDAETASLVADLEAGKPVKDKLAGLMHAAPAGVKEAAASAPKPPSAPAMQAPPPPRKTTVTARDEEPEEVLFVEPLDEESTKPAGAARSAGLDFLVERNEPPPAAAQTQMEEPMPPVGGPSATESILESGSESPPFALGAEETASPVAATRSSDEFTTNTLAELYIAQGFYDKAIDIYQRLLDDNPGNRALQAKLAELRGLAGSTITETPAAEFESPPAEPFAGVQEEFPPPPADEAPPFGGPVGEEYVPPPAAAPFEGPTDEQVLFGGTSEPSPAFRPEEPGEFALSQPEPQATPAFGGPGSFDAGFAPVEYQPPRPVAEGAPQPSVKPLQRRKETIARLEQWLQKISKEKGR